eukprot:TRINITY_DN4189_c0_g1_i1.p1 TRINITY_DN4189_c0_g1~~TRINITY_DN4189_c0_g1_i1.p1  ORF type:complete len:479 (-),score=60.65 TRINITY_DN4189_c0_g1_i1:71-1507(-)
MEMENRAGRMLVQNLTRKQFLLSFVAFVVLFIICIIIGSSGPHAHITHSFSAWRCPAGVVSYDPFVCPGVDLEGTTNSTWHGIITDLTLLNQNLELSAVIQNKNPDTSVDTRVTFRVSIGVKKAGSTQWTPVVYPELHPRNVICNAGTSQCAPVTLAREVYLNSPAYRFNVSIAEAPGTHPFIGDVNFTLSVYNASYTIFEVWFRWVFLALTLAVSAALVTWLRHLKWNEWTLEQQWTVALLMGLVAYDNPFFPVTILVQGWFFPLLDQMFTAAFVSMLLYFWVVMFDGLRREGEPRTFVGFYLVKSILVGLIFICSVIVYAWFQLHQIIDPVWSTDLKDNPGWVFFSIVLVILSVIYFAHLLWLVVVTWKRSRTLPLLGLRLKVLGIFSILVIVVVVVGMVFNFVGAEQDSSAQFLTYLGLFNLYIYFLTLVYFPTSRSAEGMGMQRLEEENDIKMKKVNENNDHQNFEDMDEINIS